MAVNWTDTANQTRSDLGLPDGRFLFISAYDALSYNARKNPEASLTAFRQAFPEGDEAVGLVIKSIRATDSDAWRALEQLAAADPRIILVDRSLEHSELLDMYRACDAFVSLHRAEGFGRNIAECMALGIPVVTTAHSGNMDFTQSDTAALVSAALRRLGPDEYHFGEGQIWAEPDIAIAALQMRRLVTDAEWREKIARAGKMKIASLYSPEIVGLRWRTILESVNF